MSSNVNAAKNVIAGTKKCERCFGTFPSSEMRAHAGTHDSFLYVDDRLKSFRKEARRLNQQYTDKLNQVGRDPALLPSVNPMWPQKGAFGNCLSCALAVQEFFYTGKPHVASLIFASDRDVWRRQFLFVELDAKNQRFFLKSKPFTVFSGRNGLKITVSDMERHMIDTAKAAKQPTAFIIKGYKSDKADVYHYWNAVVYQEGRAYKVRYFDAQSGKTVAVDDFRRRTMTRDELSISYAGKQDLIDAHHTRLGKGELDHDMFLVHEARRPSELQLLSELTE